MTTKYTYVSTFCGHEYIEQRNEDEPMYFPTCNKCGNIDYVLENSEVIDA